MANVVDCVAVGSPVLLEFLIPEVLYGCLQECECFSPVHLSAADFVHVIRAQLGNFVTDCLAHLVHSTLRGWRQSQGQQIETTASWSLWVWRWQQLSSLRCEQQHFILVLVYVSSHRVERAAWQSCNLHTMTVPEQLFFSLLQQAETWARSTSLAFNVFS